MSKNLIIIAGVVVLVLAVGAGSFYGGVVYQQSQAAALRSAFFTDRGGGTGGSFGGGGGGTGADGGVFGGGGGGANASGAAGQIKSISGNTIVLSTAQSEVTVNVSTSTQIMKLTAGALTDLQVGERIVVRGDRDASGNITATVIQPQGSRPGQQPTATP